MSAKNRRTARAQILGGRNAEADLLRLVMAFVIVLVHSHRLEPADMGHYPFAGGYLAVEFFFILSGFLAANKVKRNEGAACKDALVWTVKEYVKLFPCLLAVTFAAYGLDAYISHLSFGETLTHYVYSLFELLMLPMSGNVQTFVNAQLWYLSALLVMFPLFYACCIRSKDFFPFVVCPLSSALIYGYFCITYGHMDMWNEWTGAFRIALPRAWAGLCLGMTVHAVLGLIGNGGGQVSQNVERGACLPLNWSAWGRRSSICMEADTTGSISFASSCLPS